MVSCQSKIVIKSFSRSASYHYSDYILPKKTTVFDKVAEQCMVSISAYRYGRMIVVSLWSFSSGSRTGIVTVDWKELAFTNSRDIFSHVVTTSSI